MSSSPDQIQKEYLNHNKTLLTLFTLNSLMLLASCTLAVVWASDLICSYNLVIWLEVAIIVCAIITALGVIMSLFSRLKSEIKSQFWTMIALVFLVSLIFLFYIYLLDLYFDEYCGYIITHKGEISGNFIGGYLLREHGSACSGLGTYRSSDMNLIYKQSVETITYFCSKKYTDTDQALSDCMDLSSLNVYKKSDLIKLLDPSLDLSLVGCFFFAVLSMILSRRYSSAKKNYFSRFREGFLQNQVTSLQEQLIVQQNLIKQLQEQQPRGHQQYQPINPYITSINEE